MYGTNDTNTRYVHSYIKIILASIIKRCEETMLRLITNKSLLGMPSKRDGLIHPSVTSQPPRLTARTGSPLPEIDLPVEGKGMHDKKKEAMKKKMANFPILRVYNLVFLFFWYLCRLFIRGRSQRLDQGSVFYVIF